MLHCGWHSCLPRSPSGRSHAALPVLPVCGEERCVTSLKTAAKETSCPGELQCQTPRVHDTGNATLSDERCVQVFFLLNLNRQMDYHSFRLNDNNHGFVNGKRFGSSKRHIYSPCDLHTMETWILFAVDQQHTKYFQRIMRSSKRQSSLISYHQWTNCFP